MTPMISDCDGHRPLTACPPTTYHLSPTTHHTTPHRLPAECASLRYAPSTIAIAAVVLSFSVLQLDCAAWLAAVPDCCFPAPAPRAGGGDARFDVDACLQVRPI